MAEYKMIVPMIIGLAAVAAAIAVVWGRIRRRRRLASLPLPEPWREIVMNNVGIYAHLPPELQRKLEGKINIFLSEKTFEGCGGQEINDEIRVTVAAQACVLLLNTPTEQCYPSLHHLLIYPGSYVTTEPRQVGEHVMDDDDDVLDGSSCEFGTMTLGWEQVCGEGQHYGGGANVVFHECAHHLDYENGLSEGIPALPRPETAENFSRIFQRAYERFRKATLQGRPDVLDEYGAESPSEFFAVATETFFDSPRELRTRHPDLYSIFKDYYGLDPSTWTE